MNDKAAMFELKKQGLRAVMNAFWDIQFSDPFQALSWDRMHNYAHGLGGKHLWPILQQSIHAQGRSKAQLVDDQYEISFMKLIFNLTTIIRVNCLPRWRNLNHFKQIMSIDFSDATKLEHMIKVRSPTQNHYYACYIFIS